MTKDVNVYSCADGCISAFRLVLAFTCKGMRKGLLRQEIHMSTGLQILNSPNSET